MNSIEKVRECLWNYKYATINFLECEYVCRGMPLKSRPNPYTNLTEIVKITCLKCNTLTNSHIDLFSQLVKPFDVSISNANFEWFEELSGLSYDALMEGKSLNSAVESLKIFMGDDPVVIMGGDKDVIFCNTLRRFGCGWDITSTHNVLSLKPHLSYFFDVVNISSTKYTSSGELIKNLNAEFRICKPHSTPKHNTEWNVKSMSAFISYFVMYAHRHDTERTTIT